MAASTMTTAPFSFTLDVPILVTADLDGAKATLRTDADSIARDVAAALRRLADEIEPTTDVPVPYRLIVGVQAEALNAAHKGSHVVIALDDLESSERFLAEIADHVDHVDMPGTTYTRTNSAHRLTFTGGGAIYAVPADRSVGFIDPDTLIVSQRLLDSGEPGQLQADILSRLGILSDPHIITA